MTLLLENTIAPNLHRPDPSAVKRAVKSQLDALVVRMGISGERPHRLLEALATPALCGPFHDGRRRFSAISRDGVPFQWSVSAGPRGGALRFVADCGLPATSITERVRYCRATLADLSPWLPLGADALRELDTALNYLLPRADLLDSSLMGLCVGAELARGGAARLKVYVNGEVGDVRERYRRFAACLAAFNRPEALRRLQDIAAACGDRITPAFVAVDLCSTGIGRLKLYFRPADGTPALQTLVAEAAGCNGAAPVVDALQDAFLEGPAYPHEAVDISVEFPPEGQAGFKVDLRTTGLLDNDAEIDSRIHRLLEIIKAPGQDYRIARDVIVGQPARDRPPQIVFVGLACRRHECQADVYFHPIQFHPRP
jgi:hypothetical protein